MFNTICKNISRNKFIIFELTSSKSTLLLDLISLKNNNRFIHLNLNSNRTLYSPRSFARDSCYLESGISNGIFFRHKSKKSKKTKIKMSQQVQEEDKVDCLSEDEKRVVHVGGTDGWLTVNEYDIFGWSVSGVETCVLIKSENFFVAFDMGVAIPESVKAKFVFITHGHLDHIGAVSSHASKRNLFNMPAARYFVPPHLVDGLKTVTRAHSEMADNEALANVNVLPLAESDTVHVNSRFFVRCFPTVHRVPSQGYIVYRETKKLKDEYKGRKGFEIAALHREGKEIHDTLLTPEVAYTGDTTFEVFTNPPTPDLLKVKLLITEATFLDDETTGKIQTAREKGHCHLHEFIQDADLFKDIEHIILMHFSNKYSPKFITQCLKTKLPPSLLDKVTPAIVAKTTKRTTYPDL